MRLQRFRTTKLPRIYSSKYGPEFFSTTTDFNWVNPVETLRNRLSRFRDERLAVLMDLPGLDFDWWIDQQHCHDSTPVWPEWLWVQYAARTKQLLSRSTTNIHRCPREKPKPSLFGNLRKFLFGRAAGFMITGGSQKANAEFVIGEPELMPKVNSEYADTGPSISSDDLEFYFDSRRPGGKGNWDLYVAIAFSA